MFNAISLVNPVFISSPERDDVSGSRHVVLSESVLLR